MTSYNLKTFNCIILSLCIFLLVPVAASASQRPEPVKGLMEMFETFNNLEEEFVVREVDEGLQLMDKSKEALYAILNTTEKKRRWQT